MADDGDPVIASYNVCLDRPSLSHDVDSRLVILQYPAHRPSSRPYNAARSQQPQSLRLKPSTGVVEVEVPILTQQNYNEDAGARYGRAMSDSRTVQVGSSHGLGGGFNNNAAQYNMPSLQNIPADDDVTQDNRKLQTQTLGGKVAIPSERDPVYFLASFQDGAMHLSHLDSVIQMRPQLHHIDAEDENNQKRFQMASSTPGGKAKPGFEPPPPKLESKAIEIKMKDTKDDPRDRGLNEGARLLRSIQADTWKSHEWIDQEDDAAQAARDRLVSSPGSGEVSAISTKLRSSLSNGDWLDRMSAPREDGKKGLLAKLRGRERERARRKKAEEEKKLKSKASTAAIASNVGPLLEQSSDSDLSSPDASDDDDDDDQHDITMGEAEVIEIKEETDAQISVQAGSPSTSKPGAAKLPANKKGRPRKTQQIAVVEVED